MSKKSDEVYVDDDSSSLSEVFSQEEEEDGALMFEDGYASDLMGDDEDRATLMAMPELQREQILLKRNEERQKLQERAEAQNLWKKQKGKQREHRTQKREKGKESALEDIRARRAHKTKERQTAAVKYDAGDIFEVGREPRRPRRTKAPRMELNEEYVAPPLELDEAPARTAVPFERPQDRLPISYDSIKSLQMRRNNIIKIIDEPYFKQVVEGMFVRVSMGADSNGQPYYVVGEVEAVQEASRPYRLPDSRQSCKKALLLRIGSKNSQRFRIDVISNKTVLMDECETWCRKSIEAGFTLPTVGEAISRKLERDTLRRTFRYTDAMVSDMVRQRGGSAQTLTQRRIGLKRELQIAQAENDTTRIEEVQRKMDELNELNDRAIRRSQDTEIEEFNKRTRRSNMEREELARRQRALKERSEGAEERLDPFQRRRTRPTMSVMFEHRMVNVSPPPNKRQRQNASPPTKRQQKQESASDSMEQQLLGLKVALAPYAGTVSTALKKIILSHDVDLNIDLNATSRTHVRSYRQTYPNSFSGENRWSDCAAFQNIISLDTWWKRQQNHPFE